MPKSPPLRNLIITPSNRFNPVIPHPSDEGSLLARKNNASKGIFGRKTSRAFGQFLSCLHIRFHWPWCEVNSATLKNVLLLPKISGKD